MNNSFDIHPDFQSIKARTLSLKRWALALMRNLLAAVNALHRRKYKAIVSRERIDGPGGHRIPVQIIRPENPSVPCPALIYFHGGQQIAHQSQRPAFQRERARLDRLEIGVDVEGVVHLPLP